MPFAPHFTITTSIASAIAMIERARGFLEAVRLSDEWIAKMQQRAFVLEAHHTTHIEGTHLSLDQSEKLLAGESVTGVDAEDVKELLNYKKAFDFVADYVSSKGPITEGLIREIHKRLVEGVRGNSALPGQYRTVQNFVANSQTKEIIYTPPPPFEVHPLMADLVAWIQNEKAISPVLVAGIAQFQLVHIHPFIDGNGRTARLLSTLCLYQTGYDFKKLFTISEYYDRNRHDYYHAIQSVRNNHMDMTIWLEYFLQALANQLHELQLKGAHVMHVEGVVERYKLSDRQKNIVESMLANGERLNIQQVEGICPGVNRRTLQRDLADLIQKGLIIQEGVKKAARYRLA